MAKKTRGRAIANLVVINGLQPPWDEGGAQMTAQYVRALDGEVFVLNRGPYHSALGDVDLVSIPLARRFGFKAPSYALFAIASLYYSLRLRPKTCHFVPLCAPGPLRQLHALALSLTSAEFCEVLFQVRSPTTLLKALSSFRIRVTSQVDHDTLSSAGFDVEYLAPTPKAPTRQQYSCAALREQYGIPPDAFVVTHIGHLTEGRGVDVIASTARLCPKVRFLLVLSSREGEFQVDFPENVTVVQRYIEDIYEIYALSDLYFFPLRRVGNAVSSPLSLLEAKAARLPIVCTDLPNLRATVGNYESAHFVANGPVASMANATADILKRLLSNEY